MMTTLGQEEKPEPMCDTLWIRNAEGPFFQFERMRGYHSSASAKNINSPRLDELIDKFPPTLVQRSVGDTCSRRLSVGPALETITHGK